MDTKAPTDWSRRTLGEVTEEQSVRLGRSRESVVLSSTKYQGLVPSADYFKNRTIHSSDISNYKKVERGWFAYATNHLTEGSIGLNESWDNACTSPIYTVFSCREGTSPEYLIRVLKSHALLTKYRMFENASVDRRGAVRYADFGSVPVDLPPLFEQHLIAQILDTMDEAIRKTEELIAKLAQVKQGLLHDLLTLGVDENGELREPERHPGQFKSSPLGRIPREWIVSSCGAICREIIVGIVVRPAQYYKASGVPVLRSTNIREGRLSLDNLRFMSSRDHQRQSKSAISPGDVVTVRTGEPGTTAVVPDDLPRANCVDIIISRPGADVVSDYLALWVNSDFGRGEVLRRQGGLAQQHFNVGEMKTLSIALPPVTEQKRIVAIATAATRTRNLQSGQLAKLHLVKAGLMEDLLTGRVRVTPLSEQTTA